MLCVNSGFVKLMIMLAYFMQWSERRRLDLAGYMSSMLRAHLNAYDPIFSMALRYLIRLSIRFSSFNLQ